MSTDEEFLTTQVDAVLLPDGKWYEVADLRVLPYGIFEFKTTDLEPGDSTIRVAVSAVQAYRCRPGA